MIYVSIDFIPTLELQPSLTDVDGICTDRSGSGVADRAFQSSTRINLPPSLSNNPPNPTLNSELKDDFCIIMTVNVMPNNTGPLFVAYANNAQAGQLLITNTGITLQLYGVEAVFSGDYTGSFRQLSICVHDGVAELHEDCTSRRAASFVVQSSDIISVLTFGQSISLTDTNVFEV